MDKLSHFFNDNFTVFNIPGSRLAASALAIFISILCRKLFSLIVIRYVRKLSARTKTPLDDALIEVLNPPLGFLILLIGFWLAHMFLASHLGLEFNKTFQALLQFFLVIVVCWLIFRSADVFGAYFEKMALRTKTDLDNILAPYLKKVIKFIALFIVIIKAAEIFLGISAAALFGLLGGMGLTLGLVFKDVIANWFGCAVIYLDHLFREGDWVQLDDGKLIDADVETIGIRSTIFRNFDKTVSIVPNSIIANSVIKNWSRMYKRRISYNFSIDGISAQKLTQILDGIRAILKNDPEVHQEMHMVNFREIAGNARVIRLYYFTKSIGWEDHEKVRENINLKILQLFEQEQIEKLAYTIVDLSDDRPHDFYHSQK